MPSVTRSIPLLALLVACAGNPPPPMIGGPTTEHRASAEPVTPAGKDEVIRIAPALNYRATARMERRDSIVLTLPDGKQQVQQNSRNARFSLQVSSGGEIQVRLDSLTFHPEVPNASREAIGTVWRGKLGAHGIEELRPNRENGVTRDMTSTVEDLLPALPRAGVMVGEHWADTTSTTRRVEIFNAKDERRSAWRVGPPRTMQSLVVHPVEVTERYEQLGEGEQAGREMRMSAQGSRSATYYTTKAGRIDQVVQVDSASRLITIPETRQAIPTMQVIRTTVTFRYLP
ncbi:MAG TPA: hypothetical protein VFN22_10705 [Gemmatimonadales bacterium]|nr:hypothetical protein [Gemmatimonadales bacterium]